jgi:hypothetical protein
MTTTIYRRDSFRYTPASETNVAATWRRFGFRPTTYNQRRARQGGCELPPPVPSEDERRPTLRLAATKK